MREIKFRGISLKDGEWIYGSALNIAGEWFIWNSDIIDFDDIGDSYFPVNSETLGQLTGLRDKNGREIYEGDIVFVDGNLFYVEWRGAGDWFIDPIENDAFMFTPEIYDLEIIGNIHENPELINNEVTHG